MNSFELISQEQLMAEWEADKAYEDSLTQADVDAAQTRYEAEIAKHQQDNLVEIRQQVFCDYDAMSLKTLKTIAKGKVKGYSKLKKEQLCHALVDHDYPFAD